jgi:hypothetical protein
LPTASPSSCAAAFAAFASARRRAVLIRRVSPSDKEFHFQRWVGDRLTDAGLPHDSPGRISFPDFTLVHHPEGYEVKGLRWPGREANYDSNSRVPTGMHNDRTIWYVYGDLLVRDRKMYVAPTPFALTNGTTGQATLIAPAELLLDGDLEQVGELTRIEAESLVIGYFFDMRTNKLVTDTARNPFAGKEHRFSAYRMKGEGSGPVGMRSPGQDLPGLEPGDDE